MTSIKRWCVLLDQTSAGTGPWVALDTRYEEHATRSIQVSLTAGDVITLQGITKDVKGIDKSFLDTLEAQDISTLETYTESMADVLNANWTYIRVIKTGTTGRAKVEGFI